MLVRLGCFALTERHQLTKIENLVRARFWVRLRRRFVRKQHHPEIRSKVILAVRILFQLREGRQIFNDDADTAAFCAHYGYPPEQSANTILVASKRPQGHYSACVVLSTTRLDVNKKVCQLMGVKKASFASADITAELTGMMIGGVTPFALPDELPLYVDAAVMDNPWVILGGGSRSIKVKIAPGALVELGGQVVPELAKPMSPREPSS